MPALRLANPVRLSLALLGVFFVFAHARALPPEGWITGDQGSKFLQTRAFARNGPLEPGIEVLSHDVDPEYRQQEPKLENRGGRLVSEFLWLLPLVTAPFYAMLGLRGLYVVPALSVMVIFVAAAALGRRMGDRSGIRSGWMAVAATPVILYGLELWEHAPAAASVAVAAVLLAPDEEQPISWRRLAGAGAAVAIGSLFREEVIAALPALLLARAVALPGFAIGSFVRDGVYVAAGAAAVFVAAVPMNLVMYGAPLPMHMTQDAWNVVKTTPYFAMRQEILRALLLPQRWVPMTGAALAVGLAAALAHRRWRTFPLVHGSVLVLLAMLVGSPLWRLAHGLRVEDSYAVASAAHTWPFALALLYVPWVTREDNRRMARYLLVSGVVMLAVITLIVPMDGGAQWSPRFYLAAAPLLAVVVAAAFRTDGVSPCPFTALVCAAVVLGSTAMQLHGLMWAWKAKADTARLTRMIAENTTPEEVLISDIYWVPEVTATLAPERRMLLASSYLDIPATVAVTRQRGRPHVAIVSSFTLTGYRPPDAFDAPIVPCHLARTRQMPLPFGLLITHYACPGE